MAIAPRVSMIVPTGSSARGLWLARPTFNVMMEVMWTAERGGHEFVLSPGVRWAHNFSSGLQIVPGIAFPDAKAAFLYLSFEHRFRSEIARN